MKTFWPTFWVTLAAILVATSLIGLLIENKSRREALAKTKAEIAALDARIARLKAEREKEKAERGKNAADFHKAHDLPEPPPSTPQP